MDKIKIAIINYIKKDRTDFAILVNGEWGAGKTHYFKNEIIPEIEKLKSGDKYLKAVYVTLSGISAVDDIYRQIAAAKYKTDNKSAQIGFGVINSVANVFNINLKDNFKPEQFLSFENNVLIFDDLERISTEICISDIFGFINTNFVEHNSIKTIIITDESKFKSESEKNTYLKIKEKLIGLTLNFKTNLFDVFPKIILSYKSDKHFYKLLNNHQEFAVYLFNSLEIKNIRTIIFILEIFKEVHSKCVNKLVRLHTEKILFFSTIITKEYKDGKLETSNENYTKGLDKLDDNFFINLTSRNLQYPDGEMPTQTQEEEFLINFYNKYIKANPNKYHFFHSIFSFVSSGILDSILLNEELASVKTEAETREEDIILNRIFNFRHLDDKEFDEYIPKLINYFKSGAYNLYFYPSIFNFLYFFQENKLIDISETKLLELFDAAIDNIDRDIDVSDYEAQRISIFKRENIVVKRYTEKILQIHKEISKNDDKVKFEEIFSLVSTGSDYYNNYNQYFTQSMFDIVDADIIYKYIVKTENCNFIKWQDFFEYRYRAVNCKEFLFEDYPIIVELKKKLEQSIISGISQLRKFHIIELIKVITEVIKKLE